MDASPPHGSEMGAGGGRADSLQPKTLGFAPAVAACMRRDVRDVHKRTAKTYGRRHFTIDAGMRQRAALIVRLQVDGERVDPSVRRTLGSTFCGRHGCRWGGGQGAGRGGGHNRRQAPAQPAGLTARRLAGGSGFGQRPLQQRRAPPMRQQGVGAQAACAGEVAVAEASCSSSATASQRGQRESASRSAI